MLDLARQQPSLLQTEAEVLVVGGGTRDTAAKLVRRLQPPFPLLADPDGTAYRQFGLSKAALGLIQRSGTFLVDRDGVVRHVHLSTNPMSSLDLPGVSAALARLEPPLRNAT